MMERPWWQRILYNVWPSIYRFINSNFSLLLRIIKNTLKEAIRQIKQT